mmetsp:Transcript_1680/g.2180  ORF Transcript_1680/g.2180 Transcript_1680/m.2180 type:complete len:83 (-) Transcript_1680:762-1010(-)
MIDLLGFLGVDNAGFPTEDEIQEIIPIELQEYTYISKMPDDLKNKEGFSGWADRILTRMNPFASIWQETSVLSQSLNEQFAF